jgi:hypothetical protein
VEGASTSSSLESTSVATHARRIARRIRRFWSASAWRLSTSAGGEKERKSVGRHELLHPLWRSSTPRRSSEQEHWGLARGRRRRRRKQGRVRGGAPL